MELAERKERVVQASYFVDYVTQELVERYGEAAVFGGGGLRVYTTLDLDMQRAAEKPLKRACLSTATTKVRSASPRGGHCGPSPRRGEIRVMVGGRGEDRFNRTTQALRSPGSAIKFSLHRCYRSGITAADVYLDEPTDFELITGEIWSPQNYYETFAGEVTVRKAIEDSLNVIAAKVAAEVGPKTIIEYGKKMGITTFVEQGGGSTMWLWPH